MSSPLNSINSTEDLTPTSKPQNKTSFSLETLCKKATEIWKSIQPKLENLKSKAGELAKKFEMLVVENKNPIAITSLGLAIIGVALTRIPTTPTTVIGLGFLSLGALVNSVMLITLGVAQYRGDAHIRCGF